MHNKELIILLDSKATTTQENRSRIATTILNNRHLFFPLSKISLVTDSPISVKAVWTLKFILKHTLIWISSHLYISSAHLSKEYNRE
jgi:AraC-like DNA-binding protein|tara:strand:+ start:4701 stop:4961 length:261 start_codon:yes stop_codon:yes gene_type:complete